ncbi:MAG: rRNA pseudouridine synthase [Candidatus Marinimicrobia bacterium]|nr:rRNA pseudouridine synthase [Candidatus Neomarinimicrobiota bacterium]MBL7046477.1 rRNA pseudouridine synthase [Candidatus Neomarinimicrobiota bacterium]
MRLNRYLAHCGIASRRKCEQIVKAGRVTANNIKILNPFIEIHRDDDVCLDGRSLCQPEEDIVILLNKPADVISTVSDTHSRKTVMDLVDINERIFPVGRLDKDTTGAILLTNNGVLANKLTHPRFGVEKIYRITIDKPILNDDLRKIEKGVRIGDEEIGQGNILEVCGDNSDLEWSKNGQKCEVRVLLTHGKKREVKRIFSALGYEVLALHRESFAGISAGDLQSGEWRKLTQAEIEKLQSKEE